MFIPDSRVKAYCPDIYTVPRSTTKDVTRMRSNAFLSRVASIGTANTQYLFIRKGDLK